MSANEIFALEFTKKAAKKAPTERKNTAPGNVSLANGAGGITGALKEIPRQ